MVVWRQSVDRINCFHSSTQAQGAEERTLHVCITGAWSSFEWRLWSGKRQIQAEVRREDKLESASQYYPFDVGLERDRAGFDQ